MTPHGDASGAPRPLPDSAYIVLAVLAEDENHGYGISRDARVETRAIRRPAGTWCGLTSGPHQCRGRRTPMAFAILDTLRARATPPARKANVAGSVGPGRGSLSTVS